MNEALSQLRAAGIDNPSREMQILRDNFEGEAFEKALQERLKRVPMAQILGYRDFWRDRFIVTADVLDPRPDSELFIDLALQYADQLGHKPARILDLGTGSGALGLSLLREFPYATAVLSDVSEAALEVAKRNADALGFRARTAFIQSNWFENIDEKFDLIVCNPPYLSQSELENAQSELQFEPAHALSDGEDGLKHYHHLAPLLADHLQSKGIALFEHGFTQQAKVANIFERAGHRVEKHQDLSQNPRILAVFTKN